MTKIKTLTILEYIKIVISIIAIFWVAVEYYGNIHQKRVDRSFAFAERYLSSNVFQSHNNYYAILLGDDFVKTNEDYKKLTIDDDTYLNEISEILALKGHNVDIYTLSEFFVDISKCLQSDRCDKQTVCSFFANRVDTFVFLYGDKLKHWEDTLLLDRQFEFLNNLRDSCNEFQRAFQ